MTKLYVAKMVFKQVLAVEDHETPRAVFDRCRYEMSRNDDDPDWIGFTEIKNRDDFDDFSKSNSWREICIPWGEEDDRTIGEILDEQENH